MLRWSALIISSVAAMGAAASADVVTPAGDIEILTTFEGEDRTPAVSFDGGRVAYLSARGPDGALQLWILDPERRTERLVVEGELAQSPPAWTPDGRLIAAFESASGVRLEYVDASNGARSGAVFPDADGYADQLFPDVSRDGSRIAFTLRAPPSPDSDNAPRFAIASGSSAGGTIELMVAPPARDLWPRFESADDSIVFFSRRAADRDDDDLYRYNFVTGKVERLTSEIGHDFTPAPSPDGSMIAFTSNRSGVPALYVMSSEGGVATSVFERSVNAVHPVWAPNGAHLYFTLRGYDGAGDIARVAVRRASDVRE